ncbi:V-set and immunoglobulin domain-containing protein 10 [Gouania willdenowi]|uniref:Ig-like domain-containing protein n=1 Tax=Gouania willdenowi TaxID=441366 RepID=A0A8C5DXV4_GOUWI|nr:V-set and immunoglobulin domain-containing protein 10 [Gouania willdenowi]
MQIFAAVVFLHLSLCATGEAVSGPTETTVTAAPGDIVLLPCYTVGNVTPSLTTWRKNGEEVIISSTGDHRLSVEPEGSMAITGVQRGDEGRYECSSFLPGNSSFQAAVLLQVTVGPDNISTSVGGPVTTLPNGTLFTTRGSSVSFICSVSSYPAPNLSWSFRNELLVSTFRSSLVFNIENIQPRNQGFYNCRAHNIVSHLTGNRSTELLVYYVPERHPECTWTLAQDPSIIHFSCSWFGAYPPPKLRWEGAADFQEADSLSVAWNRSLLSDGQTMKCSARHQLLGPGEEKGCSFILSLPYPEGDPLVAALEGTNLTLICNEAKSLPPAQKTWSKGTEQGKIQSGSKYIVSEEGSALKLTIVNVSKDDEGIYFCLSENILGVRELEVYLTVKTAASAYTGGIIGVFIAALIVGSTVILAKFLYSSRHRICLGGICEQTDEDRGDVLSLVESDDEQIFQDSVPYLPPLTNGGHTTLVQIHRIPSSDHEDVENAETNLEQLEDTEESEDLVIF